MIKHFILILVLFSPFSLSFGGSQYFEYPDTTFIHEINRPKSLLQLESDLQIPENQQKIIIQVASYNGEYNLETSEMLGGHDLICHFLVSPSENFRRILKGTSFEIVRSELQENWVSVLLKGRTSDFQAELRCNYKTDSTNTGEIRLYYWGKSLRNFFSFWRLEEIIPD